MRVLIASDGLGGLSSREVGDCVATGWEGHDIVRVPIGEAGAGWLQSVADLVGEDVALLAGDPADGAATVLAMRVAGADLLAVAVEPVGALPGSPGSEGMPHGIDWSASSAPLGAAMLAALQESARPRTLAIDLAGMTNHDAGAGLLQALGAVADADLAGGVAGLGRVGTIDLSPVRELLGDCDLIGIVPSAQRDVHLLGLRGITSLAGREAGVPAEKMLAADSALERFVGLVAPERAAEAGAGACGGLGWVIRALGGRVMTGPEFAIDRGALVELADHADLVITGCDSFDFANRGGGVVAAVAKLAESALTPCIVVAGDVLIGSREMRTMGIEAAYPALPSGPVDDPAEAVRVAAARIARTWSW